MTSSLDLPHLSSGKVRELYEVDPHHLLCVTTDRISAYDVILPTPIPDKGRVLNLLSAWWFTHLQAICPHHMLSVALREMPPAAQAAGGELAGRAMLVRRVEVIQVECVIRGYLSGSGWRSYQRQGTVCGLPLPAGLRESEELPAPIFTPTTKATEGHDEPMTYEEVVQQVGERTAAQLRETALELYTRARDHARQRGIIIADTKFEFGRTPEGELLLVDEALTPDSSRLWPADRYEIGRPQESFDKQYVRDFLDRSGWDRSPPAPELPPEVVAGTRERYLEAYRSITGEDLPLEDHA